MKLSKETEKNLLELFELKNVYLEGNILKVLETENEEFQKYLEKAIEEDNKKRSLRLELSKQHQEQTAEINNQNLELTQKAEEIKKQNLELTEKAEENEKLMEELKSALKNADEAKQIALTDLDVLQKKTQFQLMSNIVKVALGVIFSIGILVTVMYFYAMSSESSEVTLIGNTWSNLLGILLTNSFSIIGTIMGVKYAAEKNEKQ